MTSINREEYANRIIEFFKNQGRFPYFIKRDSIKRKCHFCKFGHPGLLIQNYDSEKKVFVCVHGNENGEGRVYHHHSSQLRDYLVVCFKRKAIRLRPIREDLDLSDPDRKYKIQFRVSKKEKMLLEKKAAKKGIGIGEYARTRALN